MHWTYDTFAYATGVANGVIDDGGKSWYFIASDYAFGHALERDAMAVVNGARRPGAGQRPPSDRQRRLLLLPPAGPGLEGTRSSASPTAGGDTINGIKQAFEFGVMGGKQRVAALFMSIVDVRSVGLENAQGLNLVEPFYRDLDDKTRQWSERFFKRTGRMPSMVQASNYSATMHSSQRRQSDMAPTDPARY